MSEVKKTGEKATKRREIEVAIKDPRFKSVFEGFLNSQSALNEQVSRSLSNLNLMMSEVSNNLKPAFLAIDGLRSQIDDAFKGLWVKLDERFAATLEEVHETPQKAKLIAGLGWVLPNRASLPEYIEIIAPVRDILSADLAFTNYYMKDDALELRALKEDLLSKAEIMRWKPALEEAFMDLDDGRRMSCIALLLPLIDGLTSYKFAEPNFFKLKDRKAFFAKKICEAKKKGFLNRYFWQSYEAFAENLYSSCQSSPSFINRHWLLHGRDIPSSNICDCLRLLQTIETIIKLR
jgi:hypothetical protein